jgi:hypothetical protein
LNRLSSLCALHSRLTEPSLGGQMSLGPIAFKAVTRQPTAELSENRSVSHEFLEMHQF